MTTPDLGSPSEAWVAVAELDVPDDPNGPQAVAAASTVLFALSGRKYSGVSRVTEQYNMAAWFAGCQLTYLSRTEATIGVSLRPPNSSWSGRPDPRYRYDYIRLRNRPAQVVTEVQFGPDYASPLDPDSYRLVDGSVVEFLTGVREETRISYRYGTPIPAGGRLAARVLANELLRAYNGDDSCRLPDRVTSVTRQGLSYTVLDSQEFLQQGRTGLYEIDLFLKATNPDNARKRSRVFSPDLPRVRRIG